MPLQIVVVTESFQNYQDGDVSNHLTDVSGGGGGCTRGGGDDCVDHFSVKNLEGPLS